MNTPQAPESTYSQPVFADPANRIAEIVNSWQIDPDTKTKFSDYISCDPSQKALKAKAIMEDLIRQNEAHKLGLFNNFFRFDTATRGYESSGAASSDVERCFNDQLTIPETGAIVVDLFVTKNLPEIIKKCESLKIDLSRIVVRAPELLLAAQLKNMDAAKKTEFTEACAKLKESQFMITGGDSVLQMPFPEKVAVWFGPRLLPIAPDLSLDEQGNLSSDPLIIRDNFNKKFNQVLTNIVPDGRAFLYSAMSKDPVDPTYAVKPGPALPNTLTAEVATSIIDLISNTGFQYLDTSGKTPELKPLDKSNPEKTILALHVQRKA